MSDERKDGENRLESYLVAWKKWIKELITYTQDEWQDDDEKAFQEIRFLIIKHGGCK